MALISTQGNFAEYVKDFIASVIDEKAVVVTILDGDKAGRKMATSTNAINIGVDEDTVIWLHGNGYQNLTVEKVRESYSPDGGCTTEYRIEIDSILAEVGAEGPWKYIKYKIEQLKPLDLRKSIDMPANEVLYAKEIAEFLSYFNEYADNVTEPLREEIDDAISKTDELYVVAEMETSIEEDLSKELADDEGMKMMAQKLPELIKVLKELNNKDV